jgi:hypothetical protein
MKKMILAATVIIIVFTACKKNKVEEPAPAPPTHLGLWKGKFSTSTTTQPTFPMFALLTQNGEAKIYNGADTATAIKSLTGNWNLTAYANNNFGIILQYQMPGVAIGNYIFFSTDGGFVISNGNQNQWGTGTLFPTDNHVAIGLVSFTKP